MLRFTLVSEFNTPVAILCDEEPNPGQRSILFGLLPVTAFNYPELARRWEVGAVLCTVEWQRQQLARTPMLPPYGARLAFLSPINDLKHYAQIVSGKS